METDKNCNNHHIMNKGELLDAIRRDIMGEMDAIVQYDNHIRHTDNKLAKEVWTHIRDEERVHVGELFTLLATLSPDEAKLFAKGEREVKDMIREMDCD